MSQVLTDALNQQLVDITRVQPSSSTPASACKSGPSSSAYSGGAAVETKDEGPEDRHGDEEEDDAESACAEDASEEEVYPLTRGFVKQIHSGGAAGTSQQVRLQVVGAPTEDRTGGRSVFSTGWVTNII